MQKNVLVIYGSSRIGGACDVIAKEYIKDLEAANHNVYRVDANLQEFKPCTGCEMCWTDDIPCIYKDDTSKMADYLQMYDVFTIITPIYWYNFPAGLKLMIDKLYPFSPLKYNQKFLDKEVNLIITSSASNKDVAKCMGLTIQKTCDYMGWQFNKQIYIPNNDTIDDLLNEENVKAIQYIATIE